MKTGLRPDEVRAMTPRDTILFTEGWNEAQGGGQNEAPAPMTAERFRELKKQYG